MPPCLLTAVVVRIGDFAAVPSRQQEVMEQFTEDFANLEEEDEGEKLGE